ncbi:outer membrane protein [Gemmatimonadetes bacterium T265]|nr:outer membrane protein [Gemmatimonadetes bacterium T265]
MPNASTLRRTLRRARRTSAAAAAGLALAGAAGVSACTDVTVNNPSAINSNTAFSDPGAYQAFLAKLYANLAVSGPLGSGNSDIQGIDPGFAQYLRLLWQMQELPTEEAVIAWSEQTLQDLNRQTWSAPNNYSTTMYARILSQATFASEFLRQTTDAQLASRNVPAAQRAQIQAYRAEARFLRALSYWHAIDIFGSVPLVTEATPIGGAAPAQASRTDLYNFVVSELTAIRDQLPAKTADTYGRATPAAADMLLAKLYLNAAVYTGTAQYASALAAVQRIISSGAYSLDPSYQHLFLADNNTSPELIFVVTQDGAHTQGFGGTTFIIHAALGGALNDSAVTSFGVGGGWYGLRAKPELVALFGADTTAGTDQRASMVYGNGQTLGIEDLTQFPQGYMIRKYRNITSAGVPGSDQTYADTDYPMFRLGDAYLMYAEAFLRGGGGDQGTALGYVNALRTRVGAAPITASQLTLPFILDERGRELFWEGHRRTDLVRFGVFTGGTKLWTFKFGVPTGAASPASHDLYPIPANELSANPSLKQNPGY